MVKGKSLIKYTMLRTVDSATLCSRCPESVLAALVTPLLTVYLAIFALVSSSYAAYSPLFLFVGVFNKIDSIICSLEQN